MTVPRDPLRMCCGPAQDVCIPGNPRLQEPHRPHMWPFSLLARNPALFPSHSACPPAHALTAGIVRSACQHTHPGAHSCLLGRFRLHTQWERQHTPHPRVMPGTTVRLFLCPSLTPAPPPPLHSVTVASHRKGKSWLRYIILHSASSSWGRRSEVTVGSGG